MVYAGFVAKNLYGSPSESISLKLNDTLQPGKSYRLSFLLSLADRSQYAVRYFGVELHSQQPNQNFPYPIPDFTIDSLVTNKYSWDSLYYEFSPLVPISWISIGSYDSLYYDVRNHPLPIDFYFLSAALR